MNNIMKNFFYQTIFQLTKILIPIITIPIVSRALGPNGVGAYNYSNSITQYFVLFAGLGVALYGNREIALAWNKDKKVVSKVFWEIFFFKAVLTIITIILYLSIIFFLDNSILLLAQTFTLVSVLFDISWFFMGIEDFKKTSLVNLFVQIISFILIIFFVKDATDTLTYTLVQSLGIFCSQFFVWGFLKNYIAFTKINPKRLIVHLKGSFNFFIPQVAITFYTNLNKTLLGFALGNTAVGFYTNSLQLNTVFITIITTLDVVLLPHMTGLFAKDNIEKLIQTMRRTIDLQMFFSIPIMFGVLTVFDKLIPWFFGIDFLFLNHVIPYFSILIVVVPLGMSISRQYLMPIGKINQYNKSVIIGAIINILVNIVLLPTIGFYGVVIANIAAECFVTIVRVRFFKKDINFNFDVRKIFSYFAIGLLMCLFTRSITMALPATLITNIIQAIIAICFYMSITWLLKINPLLRLIQKKEN